MFLRLLLAFLAGCGGDPPPAPVAPAAPPHAAPTAPAPAPASDPLVIPASNPRLESLTATDTPASFVPEPRFYGESSWGDVRMRVVGHVAAAGRDLARARVAAGDLAGCARVYGELAQHLEGVAAETAVGTAIRGALVAAARRDGAACDALSRGEPPAAADPGVAGLRTRYAALALDARRGGDLQAGIEALARDAQAVRGPRPDLALDAFQDFEARHALRVRLVEAYAEEVDPFAPTDPWGYREPGERTRQVDALVAAARVLPGRTDPLPELLRLPARFLSADPTGFTAEELGALPTGDSLVDVAGFPGPRGIGRLELRSLEDADHRAWLEEQARHLGSLPPEAVPEALERQVVGALLALPHGSRYYNVKQARNAGVRVLARQGRYPAALAVLATHRPLRQHDWACPNRDGILRAIEGRLRLLAEDPAAEDVLRASLGASDAFLALVDGAAHQGAGAPAMPGPGPSGSPPGPGAVPPPPDQAGGPVQDPTGFPAFHSQPAPAGPEPAGPAGGSPPVRLAGPPHGGYRPQVAVGPDGTLHAVYYDRPPEGDVIRYVTSRNGQHWTAPETVSHPRGRNWGPDLVVRRDGTVVLVWDHSDDGQASGGWLRLREGGAWGTMVPLAEGRPAESGSWHVAASGEDLAIAWMAKPLDGTSRFQAWSRWRRGGGLAPPAALSDGTADAWHTNVEARPDGSVVAGWDTGPGGSETVLWLATGRAGRFAPPENITATSFPGERPQFGFDPGGRISVTWFRRVGGVPRHVYVRAGTPGAWGDTQEPSTGLGGYHFDPDVAVAPDGTRCLVWGWDGGRRAELLYVLDRGAGWTAPRPVADLGSGKPGLPCVEADAEGRFHVVWNQGVRGYNEVWYSRIEPTP